MDDFFKPIYTCKEAVDEQKLSIIMVSVDDFKQLNNNWDHLVGDIS